MWSLQRERSNNLFISMNIICKQQVKLGYTNFSTKGEKQQVHIRVTKVSFILIDHPSAWCMLSLLKMRSGSGLAVLT